MMKVLYPGSFDPITFGHMNIIEQCCNLFDEVIVAVMYNSQKTGMFTAEERVKLIENLFTKFDYLLLLFIPYRDIITLAILALMGLHENNMQERRKKHHEKD